LEVAHEARRTLAANASAASAQAHFVVIRTVYPRKTEPINLWNQHSLVPARMCEGTLKKAYPAWRGMLAKRGILGPDAVLSVRRKPPI